MSRSLKQAQNQFLEGYAEYSDAIFRFCLFKTSNREVAMDIAQDTFTKTWEYMTQGNEIENLRAFLYRTASNLIIDYHRKKKSVSLDSLQEEGFDIGIEIHGKNEDAFDLERVLKIIKTLDNTYKDVLLLRFTEDMAVKDIAKILNESENTISVRIHRGIERIKNLLQNGTTN